MSTNPLDQYEGLASAAIEAEPLVDIAEDNWVVGVVSDAGFSVSIAVEQDDLGRWYWGALVSLEESVAAQAGVAPEDSARVVRTDAGPYRDRGAALREGVRWAQSTCAANGLAGDALARTQSDRELLVDESPEPGMG